MHNEIYVRQLLSRYLSDQCSDSERETLFVYLQTPAGKRLLGEVLDEESEKVFAASGEIDPEISGKIFSRLKENIETGGNLDEEVQPLFLFSKRFLQMAAGFIGFLMVLGIGYKYYGGNKKQVIATESGQMRTVILPDGSRVILNSNSTLTYDLSWEEKNARRVELEGEAFFDVAHNAARPFFVKTQRMEIRVLGTAFNVKSDAVHKIFETTLVRGKVTVKDLESPDNKETVLQPNEQAVFSTQLSKLETAKVAPDESSYWHRGHLVFEDEPVQVITRELEKWYHVKIDMEEETKNCRFNLRVDKETLPEVLRLFEAVTGAESVITGKNVMIRGKLCEGTTP